ncbi:MAG TPA: group II intron reverse transcriptase/maturase [Candidatus Paceibacterota bacterium]|nr:group II intron reverse transcriptase/maturase [Candidatus Paceibacterota bacterium]
MVRQESEDCTVPKASGNRSRTRIARKTGGGKAVPVKEEGRQRKLNFVTAESPWVVGRGAEGKRDGDRSPSRVQKVAKAKSNLKGVGPARMEEVVERLEEAFEKVAANQGAPGPDRQSIERVREHLPELLPVLRASLLDGSYRPGDIRRVWIPKAGGGQRGLGIPNVVDRMVMEAVRRVLEPLYEPTFHESSHGFRPNRSCQTAIMEAGSYAEQGYDWVVDLDLEKFFDRVHQQRLMGRLAQRVSDKRVLVLIGRMLKAKVVMPDGVKVSTEEGVPQGGPLSPLLSNIVLSELDEELARRGHRFVRYADDCNIYVRSERAGQRVKESVSLYISRRLRLKVNESKSAVARPETRHFLGYRLQAVAGGRVEVLLSERSEKRLREHIRELTPRSRGQALKATITEVNAYLRGWFGHFRVCTPGIEWSIQRADAHIRRRLRAIVLKHWKTKRTIVRRLIRLGVRFKTAWRRVYEGRQSLWALSHNPAVDRALRNAYFADRGLVRLQELFEPLWAAINAPAQLVLPLGTTRS